MLTTNRSARVGQTNLSAPQPTFGDAFLTKLDASNGGVVWARNEIVIPGTSPGVFGAGVAVDAVGNAYVTASRILKQTASKVAPDGSLVWQHQFTSAEWFTGAIAVSGNNVVMSGVFATNVDFDPGPKKAQLNSTQLSGFVLKLTTAGSYVWARAFMASDSGSYCAPDSVAVDSAGNVYTSGSLSGNVDFDPGKGKLTLNSGSGAGFISKLNSSGNFVWAKQLGVTLGGDSALTGPIGSGGAMTVDAGGAVYLTGGFTGTVDFNPGSGVFNLTSAGGQDIFVSKLDTNGNFQWAIRAGSTGDDFGTAIAVNSFGDIYVTGSIGGGTVDFDLTSSYFDNRDLLNGPGGFLWQLLQP